jgi:hypothetical protein
MPTFEPTDRYLKQTLDEALSVQSRVGILGYGAATLYAADGSIKQLESFINKISDNGDLYYATRAAALIAPSSLADVSSNPGKLTGMKLGSNSATAPGKATGNNLGAYISGTNKIFTSIALTNLGSGLGQQVGYLTNWTGAQVWSGIVEAVLTDGAATDATPAAAANVISRVTFAAVNKGTTDTFAIQWNHVFLG